MGSSACLLDLYPAWLIRSAQDRLAKWTRRVVNSLMESVAACHKQAVVQPLLKEPSLISSLLDNHCPVSNLLFLGKVIEQVVWSQLLRVLNEADYLEPFFNLVSGQAL